MRFDLLKHGGLKGRAERFAGAELFVEPRMMLARTILTAGIIGQHDGSFDQAEVFGNGDEFAAGDAGQSPIGDEQRKFSLTKKFESLAGTLNC